MSSTLHRNLLRREIDAPLHSVRVKTLYGDPGWVRQLDCVKELDGHTGCVNTLAWSQNGQFLASGSDDHKINIFSHRPTDSVKLFSLSTTIHTGHTMNIFSVKFMPYSNDNVLVSCAGDDVRVFDIEYSSSHKDYAEIGQNRRQAYHGSQMRDLSFGEANGKIFGSHRDSVKRIVTEASPFVFLTCSEDGDVRQFDLRLPTSSYPPAPRWLSSRATKMDYDPRLPPPLISYFGYGIAINSISCSPQQPHYIVLGGQHPHCFLHDRRMSGQARCWPRSWYMGNEVMDTFTRCVRRFAPPHLSDAIFNSYDSVTCCKISDARPNEMIVSWSSDHIYLFDLTKDSITPMPMKQDGIVRPPKMDNPWLHSWTFSPSQKDFDSCEGVPQAERIAELVSILRGDLSLCFRLKRDTMRNNNKLNLRGLLEHLTPLFQKSLSDSIELAQLIDDAVTLRPLPTSTPPDLDDFPGTLTALRNRARRFANNVRLWTETLLHLSGKPPTCIHNTSTVENFHLEQVYPYDLTSEKFVGAVIEKMSNWAIGRDITTPGKLAAAIKKRKPKVEPSDGIEPLPEWIEYYQLARGSAKVSDYDAEPRADESIIFNSEIELVTDLANFMEQMGWKTGTDTTAPVTEDSFICRWLLKIARNLLLSFGEGYRPLNPLLQVTFGGKLSKEPYDDMTRELANQAQIRKAKYSEHVQDNKEDKLSHSDSKEDDNAEHRTSEGIANEEDEPNENEDDDANADEDNEVNEEDEYDSEFEEEYEDNSDRIDYDSDSDESTLSFYEAEGNFSPAEARRVKKIKRAITYLELEQELVQLELNKSHARLTSSHDGLFFGACNAETTKECAYFGLNDEYVVAGSDTGHVFIWDRFKMKLVNILHGDEEVVNVVESHPHEPMLAVSGIDQTIKIFSTDTRMQAAMRTKARFDKKHCTPAEHAIWPTREEIFAGPLGDEWYIHRLPPTHKKATLAHGRKSRKAFENIYAIVAKNEFNREAAAIRLEYRQDKIENRKRHPDTGERLTLATANDILDRLYARSSPEVESAESGDE